MKTTSFRAGFGAGSITVYEPGVCMFGWGNTEGICRGVEMPLYARAIVVEDRKSARRIAYVVCDLGILTESVRQSVGRRVCTLANRLTDHDLMIASTHTHSGPGGYSTYLFYALAIPGVSVGVHDAIVDGIVEAIERAIARLEPARLYTHSGEIPLTEPVAFNRSIEAYNRNHDVTPVSWERRDEAVDRTMTVLRVENEHGTPLGMVSWFAVHGTSLHSDHQRALHGDNKGHAARACEAWARSQGASREQGFVALFAQESAGDVTPNYRWDARRALMIGRFDEDHRSASFAGDVQARHAHALFARATIDGLELEGTLDSALRYRDFFRVASPCLGLGMALGTAEGKGPLFPLRRAFPWLTRLQAGRVHAQHGAKIPLCDLGIGAHNRAFGFVSPRTVWLEAFRDRFTAYFREAVANRASREATWVPRYLPIQQFRIGSFAIASIPMEPTTVAGRRIRRTVLTAWGGTVERTVVAGYANAYCSYLTTPEEYEEQAYEGASNLYGPQSLAEFCNEHRDLARDMRAGASHASLGTPPEHVPLTDYVTTPGRPVVRNISPTPTAPAPALVAE